MGGNPAPLCSPQVRSTAGDGCTASQNGLGSLKATQPDLLPQPDQRPVCPLSGTAGVQRELLSLGRSRAQLPAPGLCSLPRTAHPALE